MPVGVDEAVGRIAGFVGRHPELAAAAVVSVLAVGSVGYALKQFTRPMGKQFVDAVSEREELAVLTHPNPDPDAMAAAMGVARLADELGVDATIQFAGQVRHQENRAFRNLLDVDLVQIEAASELAAEAVVLVDHNEPRGFTGAEAVIPFAVVDHHPGDGSGETFTDVRTEYGACSTIVAKYFRDLDAVPVPPERHESELGVTYPIPSQVATGLLFGILTDTNHLTSGVADADFDASRYLYPGVNESLLERIANPQVSADVLETKARAIENRTVEGPFAISDVGSLSNVDAVPQAADELIKLEGVTAAVVYGEREGTIHLSGRSHDDRIHMGRTLQAAVSDVPNATAGGHARMGGGQIDPADEESAVAADRRSALVSRLFEALEGDI
ncbi:DHH family phosphoesterase [Salinirarus marinus]|uniref:DHH family phosphoesterase n=1 Tax=Salinirarus marinus TaxID=3068310 RepID=UPI003C6BEF0E